MARRATMKERAKRNKQARNNIHVIRGTKDRRFQAQYSRPMSRSYNKYDNANESLGKNIVNGIALTVAQMMASGFGRKASGEGRSHS